MMMPDATTSRLADNPRHAPASQALPRRVLHVLNAATGGAAISTLRLMEALRAEGIEPFAACHDMGLPAEREAILEVTKGQTIFLPLYWLNKKIRSPVWKRPLLEARQLARTRCGRRSTALVAEFAERHKVDLIHTNTILTPEGGKAARALKLPHVWHVRELIGPGKPFRLPFEGPSLGDYLQAHASSVIANSWITAEQIRPWLPAGLLHVVCNGIDIQQFVARSPGPKDRLVIAMVASQRARWKKHDLFIRAASQVDRSLPIEFRIYGEDPARIPGERDAYSEGLHALVDSLGLADRFRWPGFVYPPQRIMSEVDILVHPADHESFGRVIVEAMAAGLPVVAVRGGGAAEIVVDGVTGMLTDIDSPRQMGQQVQRLARDAALRTTMGQAGRARAIEHYSLEAYAGGVREVYRDAMRSPVGVANSTFATDPRSRHIGTPRPNGSSDNGAPVRGQVDIVHFSPKRWEEFQRYGFRKTAGHMFECLARHPGVARIWFVQSDRRLGVGLRRQQINDRICVLGLPNGERGNWTAATRNLNRWLLRRHLQQAARPELTRIYWFYDWFGLHVIGGLPRETTVMEVTDVVDDLLSARPDMLANMRRLKGVAANVVDLTFAVAPSLAEELSLHLPNVVVAPNAIGAEFLSIARTPCPEPAALADLPHPRLAVVGTFWSLNHRLDHELLIAAMRRMPDWRLVIIGCSEPGPGLARLAAEPNVRLIGMQRQMELARLIQHVDVCAVPYRAGPPRRDALKTYEYLAAHKPVVLTVDEVQPALAPYTRRAIAPELFAAACRELLGAPFDTESVDAVLSQWTWEKRAEMCLARAMELAHQQASARASMPAQALGSR